MILLGRVQIRYNMELCESVRSIVKFELLNFFRSATSIPSSGLILDKRRPVAEDPSGYHGWGH
jgi:hypothetical protein